jgi:outer membrane lipoprotein-sorting protein
MSLRDTQQSSQLHSLHWFTSKFADTPGWGFYTNRPALTTAADNEIDPDCFSSYHEKDAAARGLVFSNGIPMNRKPNGNMPRALVLAILQLGLLAGLQLGCAALAEGQTTDEIVAKVLAARGGLEKVKAVQTERITGTLYFNPELYGPFLAEFKRPGKMHNEMTIQNKTVTRSFNGKDAGWVINPFLGKVVAEPMTAEDVKEVVNEADFDGPLVDSKAKGNTIELTGTEKVEGRDAYVIKVTHKDGQVSSYSFDAKTFLLAKWTGTETMNDEVVTHQTLFHDYRDIGGLKFAFELVSTTSGADVTQRIIVEKIEIDPQIDEAHFGKPPAPAPPAAAAPDPPPGRR